MNSISKKDKEHIITLKKLLNEKFNNIIEKIYCYGSRVTSNRVDTDFDILIITKEEVDWRIEDKIDSEIIRYGIENNILFDAHIYSSDKFSKYSYTPYLNNAITLGIAL
ncbi:MAG: hypothetical protein KJ666_18140 [Bacteroidetes bacterium]|nr:hypothetical protein [Bacteroidota bacterium]MBU2583719.1 hypothetical protein [Bacteroidota bacterium]